jgi:CHASE3 domain sensor protein
LIVSASHSKTVSGGIPVSRALLVGFAIISLIACGLAALSYVKLSQLADTWREAQNVTFEKRRLANLGNMEFGGAIQAFKNTVLRADDNAVKAFAKSMEAVEDYLSRFEKIGDADADEKKNIDDIKKRLAAYSALQA